MRGNFVISRGWGGEYVIAGAVGANRFAYEIDLGNKNVAVAPTSLGEIRALYR
jgi:hypothetical protein